MKTAHASDLFVTEGKPPAYRVHGSLVPLDVAVSTAAEIVGFLEPFSKEALDSNQDLDLGVKIDGSRFRLSVFRQQGRLALVARALSSGAVDWRPLGIPAEAMVMADAPRGLVLVVGATGAGKSTTMAAMVHQMNQRHRRHVVTIEDPIEFVHEDLHCRISQREIGRDSSSFAEALRRVLRQSPDVIVIGELRDQDTATTAISAALTGHLVLATLHTSDATQTLQRLLALFPEEQRNQVALDLSTCLVGVLAQRLLPTSRGDGRVLATELLTATPPAARLIREQRLEDVQDLLNASHSPQMCSFNHSLLRLFRSQKINFKTGRMHATNSDEFALNAQGMSTGVHGSGDDEVEHASSGLDMRSLLAMARKRGASDLHISVGRPPTFRIHGDLMPLDSAPLTVADLRLLLFSILTGRQRTQYELEREIDFALVMEDGQRFRVNAYYHTGDMAASLRAIASTVPDAKELGLPFQVLELGRKTRGLLLFVGPTGSGKTTSMACLIDRINQSRACRIITIEDPIEYVYPPGLATIDQREVGEDTASFGSALKYVLRQDPDVILVGEMRDLETISAAITAAETGHLVLATLHSNDAVQAIDRIVDVFSANAQGQIRSQLAASLLGVVSQRLLPSARGKGRIGVFEIMVANHAIRNLIRENKMHQAAGAIETSQSEGMKSLDQALIEHLEAGRISYEEAQRHASNPKAIISRLG